VTLDDDVVDRAKRFSHKRGIPFRQALNDLVRAGLASEATPKRGPLKFQPKDLGLRPGLSYDNIERLLEIGEGPRHR
jgi:hypothetical protein